MSKLIIKMKYAEVKWKDYIKQEFGEELSENCKIESVASAKNHEANIQVLNFKKDANLIDKIKQHENVISAFIIDNKSITETIKE